MKTILVRKETSYKLLTLLKELGEITSDKLSQLAGLPPGNCKSNLYNYVNHKMVEIIRAGTGNGHLNRYRWIGGDAQIKMANESFVPLTRPCICDCGKPGYRMKGRSAVCKDCDEKESRMYGHRITKFFKRNQNEETDDTSWYKYAENVYAMPARATTHRYSL